MKNKAVAMSDKAMPIFSLAFTTDVTLSLAIEAQEED